MLQLKDHLQYTEQYGKVCNKKFVLFSTKLYWNINVTNRMVTNFDVPTNISSDNGFHVMCNTVSMAHWTHVGSCQTSVSLVVYWATLCCYACAISALHDLISLVIFLWGMFAHSIGKCNSRSSNPAGGWSIPPEIIGRGWLNLKVVHTFWQICVCTPPNIMQVLWQGGATN